MGFAFSKCCTQDPYKKCPYFQYSVAGQNFYFLFSGATFDIPLTKSATLNRLLHCSLWQFSGGLFYFWGLFFAFRGRNRPEPLCIFSPAQLLVGVWMVFIEFFFIFFIFFLSSRIPQRRAEAAEGARDPAPSPQAPEVMPVAMVTSSISTNIQSKRMTSHGRY